MMSNLKPCPFCGGYAFTGTYEYPSGVTFWHVYHYTDTNCYLSGILPDYDTEEDAVEAWNRRVSDEKPEVF